MIWEWNQDRFRAERLAGPELAWRPTDTQRIEAGNLFYHSFTPWSEFRNLSDLHWKWEIADNPALGLKARFENEYQSDVAPGTKKNDLKYYTSVGIDF